MITIKTRQTISVHDWDALVEETYGRPYTYQQQDDCKDRGIDTITVPVEQPYDYENDSVPDVVNGNEMGVSFAAWLARDIKEWNGKDGRQPWIIDLFWARNFYPSVDMVINDLHAKGLLPAGEYDIIIDW